jgi:DNA repair protein RadC
MRELAPHDRPREKLDRAGVGALGDNELLAVLIGHGTAGANALGVANRLLASACGVHGLTRTSRDELTQVPGVGLAVAARVTAAIELGRRTLMLSPAARPRLGSPREVARFLLPQYGAYPVERFGVLLLDARHRLIRVRLLSSGVRDASLVHPREVFREAVLAGASAIVAFHNHPSGDPTPSDDDLALTERLVSAGRVMGIDLVDHVILADTHYCSLKEMGHQSWRE